MESCEEHPGGDVPKERAGPWIDFAEEKDVDAIIVGKWGWGGIADLLLGSVSQKLVNLANRTVMVVPQLLNMKAGNGVPQFLVDATLAPAAHQRRGTNCTRARVPMTARST
jgi:Universal stress protein family